MYLSVESLIDVASGGDELPRRGPDRRAHGRSERHSQNYGRVPPWPERYGSDQSSCQACCPMHVRPRARRRATAAHRSRHGSASARGGRTGCNRASRLQLEHGLFEACRCTELGPAVDAMGYWCHLMRGTPYIERSTGCNTRRDQRGDQMQGVEGSGALRCWASASMLICVLAKAEQV